MLMLEYSSFIFPLRMISCGLCVGYCCWKMLGKGKSSTVTLIRLTLEEWRQVGRLVTIHYIVSLARCYENCRSLSFDLSVAHKESMSLNHGLVMHLKFSYFYAHAHTEGAGERSLLIVAKKQTPLENRSGFPNILFFGSKGI